MPSTLKTEAIILRSIRYGEADRILHLYTPQHGRIGAIAKGARRPRSRFGGRLEPCSRLDLVLYKGRGDLFTVTGVDTVVPHRGLRQSFAALSVAGQACEAVSRLFSDGDPHADVYYLLANELSLLDRCPDQATPANAVAFRLKLVVAAGFVPHLSACASCGENEHLVGFSGAAGGVVCSACESNSFALSEDAHNFLVQALAQPLAEAPAGERQILSQAERAISDVVAHHAGVSWSNVVSTR